MVKTISQNDGNPAVKIAILNNDIKHINETLARLEGKFDIAVQSFATTNQLLTAQSTAEAKHKEFDKYIERLNLTVERLDKRDSEQQGAIEANQKYFNRVVAIVTLAAVVLGALWWIPALLHR